jgi:y4mF family transcriptional regulator
MSTFKEPDALRLICEMRERDAMFKALDTESMLKAVHKPFEDIAAQVAAFKPLPQMPRVNMSQLSKLDVSAQRAIDIARQLTRVSSGVSASAIPSSGKSQQAQVSRQAAVRTAGDLGAMIRKARKAMKLNQTEFAAHAGVGRRFISELESGKGSLEFDKVLACAITAGIDITARSRTG